MKKHVTVVGGGITGLTVANILQGEYEVTLVARDLPIQDHETWSKEYASPL